MAYDKVVDSSVLNTGLTKIANAIREKGGTSANLAFPDAMAAAIAAIEAGGGGLLDGITEMNTGSFTPAADITSNYTWEHGLSRKPNFWAFYAEYENVETDLDIGVTLTNVFFGIHTMINGSNGCLFIIVSDEAPYYEVTSMREDTLTTATLIGVKANSMSKLQAGITYHWIATVVDGMA